MGHIEFKNGFLSGLLATGIGIGGSTTAGGGDKLPPLEILDIINLTYYNNAITYLKESSYTTLLSSSFPYMPKEAYVIIGGYDLYDIETNDWWVSPKADVRVTVDGKVVYEGPSIDLFGNEISFDPPKVYHYKTGFEFAARRKNLTDAMQMQLRETMIVGIK